jgi:hypothetical protein
MNLMQDRHIYRIRNAPRKSQEVAAISAALAFDADPAFPMNRKVLQKV